jgi:hypothetical protein
MLGGEFRRQLLQLRLPPPVQNEAVALGGQQPGEGRTDAAGGAGDEGEFIVLAGGEGQVVHTAILPSPPVGYSQAV